MVSVQKEYAESMLENTPQDFLQVLLSQQTQISNLKSLNERLSAENEDLLQLSENAKELAEENKALKNANEKLRNEKSRLEWQLKQSQDNEQSIRKQMEDMGDSVIKGSKSSKEVYDEMHPKK